MFLFFGLTSPSFKPTFQATHFPKRFRDMSLFSSHSRWIFGCGILALLAPTSSLWAADARPAVQAVSVLSFNIRYDTPVDGPNRWPHRKELVRSVIETSAADFVGLQEVTPMQWDYLRRVFADKYGGLIRTREKNPAVGEAVPLLYRLDRWELDPSEQGTFWLSETPDVPGSGSWETACVRITTWGRFIERKTGRAVYVFNTHLDHRSEEARYQGARLIRWRIEQRRHDDPVLLMGDFNVGESGEPIRLLLDNSSEAKSKNKAGRLLVDTFRQAHPEAKDVGTFHGFDGQPSPAKIDYLFASPPCRVEEATIIRTHENGRYPSDHFPISAKVRFPLP